MSGLFGESSSSETSPTLVERREVREAEYFRNTCEEDYGFIKIGEEELHSADIIEKMISAFHESLVTDYRTKRADELIAIVCEQYPSPIAVPFNAFMHGAREPLSRLGYLCDTWEGLTQLLFSLSVSECVAKGVSLGDVTFAMQTQDNPRSIKYRNLRTESIATRIEIMRGIRQCVSARSIPLLCLDMLEDDVFGELRRLNAVRNEFSHTQTKSTLQANKIIESSSPDMLAILDDCSWLANVDLLRVHAVRTGDPAIAEIENLCGHARSRRLTDMTLTPETREVCLGVEKDRSLEPVLFHANDECWRADPFYCCRDNESGHHTEVAMLKRVLSSQSTIEFEVIGDSVSFDVPSVELSASLERLQAAVKAPEGVDAE